MVMAILIMLYSKLVLKMRAEKMEGGVDMKIEIKKIEKVETTCHVDLHCLVIDLSKGWGAPRTPTLSH